MDVAVARPLRARIGPGWQFGASCASADPESWFPDAQGAQVKPAVTRVCASCPVRRSCLAAALLWNVEGIWAGTTERERIRLRKWL
ncbi:MAG: WhiB family transcriptional regulator, partial [Nocardioidaceae bacterium]|nr:WhiB family transcriptional regulator [Nocardioidaceae bacterium]